MSTYYIIMASMAAMAVIVFVAQFEADRYPYPALKKNRATNTMTAIAAIDAIII